MDAKRCRAVNKSTCSLFYKNLQDLHEEHGTSPPERMWNADETNFQIGRASSQKVVAPKGARHVNTPQPDNRAGLTYLACVNAEGYRLPGLYLFKGKRKSKDPLELASQVDPGAASGCSPTAYMTEHTWWRWLLFFNNNVPGGMSIERKHMLIIDQCKVHMSLQVAQLAKELGIVILLLPAHTSHRLQPLDISGFGVAKEFFRDEVANYLFSSGKTSIHHKVHAELVAKSVQHGLSPANIRAGFRAAGIWPFNEHAIDKYYVASKPFQRRRGRRGRAAGPVPEGSEGGTLDGEEVAADAAPVEVADLPGGDEGQAEEDGDEVAAAEAEAHEEAQHWAWMDGIGQQADDIMPDEAFWDLLHDVDEDAAGRSNMVVDEEAADEEGEEAAMDVLDMDEAARAQQAEDVPAAAPNPPSNVDQTTRPPAPTFNRERIEQLLALPTFSLTSNKRKRSTTYAGHSKIMTSAAWMAEAEAEERRRQEKLAAVAGRKAAAAAKRAEREERMAEAARDKPFGPITAAERVAAKARWVASEKEMRTILWPAPGEEKNPDRLALLARLPQLQHQAGASSSPAAAEARARRFQQLKERRRVARVAANARIPPGAQAAATIGGAADGPASIDHNGQHCAMH